MYEEKHEKEQSEKEESENQSEIFETPQVNDPDPGWINCPMFRLEPLVLKGVPQEKQYEAFRHWCRCLENILDTTSVPEEKRFSNLMAYGGPELQKIYYNIDKTAEEKKPLYKDALERLEKYLKPKHHAVFARHKFWQLNWESEDSLDDVVMKVKEASSYCNFGKDDAGSLEIAMLDKFIMLVPQEVKEKLLQESDLTFDEAVKIVKAHEATKYQARELSGRKTSEFAVNAITKSLTGECFRCSSRSHKANDEKCPAKDAICNSCGKRGHFSRKCMSRSGTKRPYEWRDKEPNKRRRVEVRHVKEEIDNDSPTSRKASIFNINDKGVKVVCTIGNVHVSMMVDSGTSRNIVDENTWNLMLANGFIPHKVFYDDTVQFMGYGNKKLRQMKAFVTPISCTTGKKTERNFYVLCY